MTLAEIAESYSAETARLRAVLRELRRRRRLSTDAEERAMLRVQISWTEPVYRQMKALAELCAHYYDAGFYRDPDYTLQGVYIHGDLQ